MAEQLTIGAQLQQARQERGESLEQTHQRTGIGVRVLRGLEEDSVDVVELVYIRMALLTYAGYLGLDTNELAGRFDAEHGSPRLGPPVRPVSPPASGAPDLMERLREVPRIYVIGGAVAAAIVAILLIWHLVSGSSDAPPTNAYRTPEPAAGPASERSPTPDPQLPDRSLAPTPSEQVASSAPASAGLGLQTAEAPAMAATPPAAPPEDAGAADTRAPAGRADANLPLTEPPVSDAAAAAPADAPIASPARVPETTVTTGSLVLQARAVDSTWVRVQWDEEAPVEEIIPRGQTRRWEAGDHLRVVAGRAHGVQFRFQGELLGEGRLGRSTEILRFRASRDGVYLLGPDLRPISRVDNPQESSATAPDTAGP